MISAVYAAAARRRREWYAARPDARARLRRPVISVGNIAVGGRGKTPVAAAIARLLLELGERPAILSRGYGRTEPVDGAVIVRDADGIRADVARAGDEPFMLARHLPGAIVVTSPDRFVAGRLAEHHLGATVHVLDDGFQHVQLDRDIDIVLVAPEDLGGGAATLPSGRLREPADVLVAADAILAAGDVQLDIDLPVFGLRARTGDPVFDPPFEVSDRRVVAVAGIARPEPFFEGLRQRGWTIAATRTFRDHHPYSRRDLEGLSAAAAAAGAEAIVTTEKDYVRLLQYRPFAPPVGWVPHTMEPDPPAEFRRWLVSSMAAARDIVLV